MSIILYLLYCSITFLLIFYLFFTYKFSYWKSRGVPHLKPRFPFGNIPAKEHFIFFTVNAYKNLQRENHRFVGGYMFSNPIAIPTDLDLIKDILKKDFEYFIDRGIYHNERDDPLSANLLSLEGQQWRSLRTKLTPTFTSGKMKIMFPMLIEICNRFHTTLSNILQQGGAKIEIREILMRFTLDMIGHCAFGIECNTLNDPNSKFLKMAKKAFDNGRWLLFKRILQMQFPDFARFLRMKWFPSDVGAFFMYVVNNIVEYRKANCVQRNDFMKNLLEIKSEKFENSNEIAAQVLLFILAGFETAASAVSYAIYEFSLNQDLQERARGEINKILKKHNGHFTYEAMMEMKYIEQVVSETIRKYPPVPFLFRIATKDYKVSHTNQTIQKGILVTVPVYAVHHDSKIYPDPEKFDPERFTTENMKSRHSSTFLGFGDGMRNCIGERFGRMQTRIGLVTLLRNFKFDKCSKTQIPLKFSKTNPMLSAENGIWVRMNEL